LQTATSQQVWFKKPGSIPAVLTSYTLDAMLAISAHYPPKLSCGRSCWENFTVQGPGVECHIDSPGEPMLYPHIVELVKELKKIPEVAVVSMQSNGTLLDAHTIKQLEEAGLTG
jgi:hypothetical protein